jgi:hypothetical protein
VWQWSELLLKVKAPIAPEYPLMPPRPAATQRRASLPAGPTDGGGDHRGRARRRRRSRRTEARGVILVKWCAGRGSAKRSSWPRAIWSARAAQCSSGGAGVAASRGRHRPLGLRAARSTARVPLDAAGSAPCSASCVAPPGAILRAGRDPHAAKRRPLARPAYGEGSPPGFGTHMR